VGIRDWFRRSPAAVEPPTSPGGSVVIVREQVLQPRVGTVARTYVPEREAVYRELWGEPKFVSHEVVPLIPHIDVYVYPPGTRDRGFYTLVTGGMSDLRMQFPEDASPKLGRAELVLYAHEPKEDYIALLRTIAHHPHANAGWMTHGYTIPNGQPPEPLFPGSELCVVLLVEAHLRPEQLLFNELLEIEGDRVELLELLPITERECDLKLQAGSGALLSVFNQNRLSFILDEGRRSFV